MSKINKSSVAVMAAAATLAGPVLALEPAGYKTTEGLLITPTLGVVEAYDDNYRALSANEQSTFITTLAPMVNFRMAGRSSEFNLDAGVSHDVIHDSRDDDNTDVLAGLSFAVVLDRRSRLKLNAGYRKNEDTASLVQKIENDKYTTSDVGAVFGFGAETARGQLEFAANRQQVRFDNDALLPGGQRLNADRERDVNDVSGTLFVAVAPKTKGLLELRRSAVDYVTNTALDTNTLGVLVGAKWEATAMTTGSVKLGRGERKFTNVTGLKRDRTLWEAGVTWSPLTYSSFTLTTDSRFDEGAAGASVIESDSTSLGWNHKWRERLSSSADVRLTHQDYIGSGSAPGGADRSDEILGLGLGVTYAMRRWLDVGAGYRFTDSDSNAVLRSFSRNIVSLTVNASL